jgi:hypothetical protein
MLGSRARDARRTEIYLDGLLAAEERGASDAPLDLDVDPAVVFAARRLRADLIRPHPSFRFEEGLAYRLGLAANPAASLRALDAPAGAPEHAALDLGVPRLGPLSSKSARPLIVGGVASAISIGAVYVAWRWSRGSGSATAHAENAGKTEPGHSSGRGRRVLGGIFGVMP